jgi:hypothetical protein
VSESSDEATVREIVGEIGFDNDHPVAGAIRRAFAAGRAAAYKSLSIDDEPLVSEVAFEVGQATKQQPHMGGKRRGGHGEQENRRIARAAIRAISRAGGTTK